MTTPRIASLLALLIALACGRANADEPIAEPASASDATATEATTATPRSTVVIDERTQRLQREQAIAEGTELSSANDVRDHSLATNDAERAAALEDSPLSHRHQFGLRAGGGYFGLLGVRYKGGARCDASGSSFCKREGVPFLDLDLSFGVTSTVELALFARLGMSDDAFTRDRPLLLGFGARAYMPAGGVVKGFFGGRAYIAIEDADVPDWSPVDVGVRGEVGLQVDVIRYLGLYLQVGVGLQFLNSAYFLGDASGGLQVRVP